LQQEIIAEGISRNLGSFSRFLEIAAAQSGEIVNFTSISRDCALQARTVQGYYEILEDTLMGFRLEPWGASERKRLASHPKFYLFDCGVINSINRRLKEGPDPIARGRLFEHFIILETWRLRSYLQSEARLFFWRTSNGLEIDLLIEKHGTIVAACEIKSSSIIEGMKLSGLRSFSEEYPDVPRFVVAQVESAYEISGIRVIPWQRYLELVRTWL
jgi:predicted AAA+ superfamily ATPase